MRCAVTATFFGLEETFRLQRRKGFSGATLSGHVLLATSRHATSAGGRRKAHRAGAARCTGLCCPTLHMVAIGVMVPDVFVPLLRTALLPALSKTALELSRPVVLSLTVLPLANTLVPA